MRTTNSMQIVIGFLGNLKIVYFKMYVPITYCITTIGYPVARMQLATKKYDEIMICQFNKHTQEKHLKTYRKTIDRVVLY